MPNFDYDTVKRTERKQSVVSQLGDKGLLLTTDVDQKRCKKGILKNFTCPECGAILPEVVTVGGKPVGWCGVRHKFVGG